MYINLLEETNKKLIEINKTWNEVLWIGLDKAHIDITDFINAAREANYDPGFGCAEVDLDLIIFFKDNSWLSRQEYDGKEWWHYNTIPKKPIDPIPFPVHKDQLLYRHPTKCAF